MRRNGQRVNRSAEHFGPAAQGRTQIGFTGLAFTHFQLRNADEITPVPTGHFFTGVDGPALLTLPGKAGVGP